MRVIGPHRLGGRVSYPGRSPIPSGRELGGYGRHRRSLALLGTENTGIRTGIRGFGYR